MIKWQSVRILAPSYQKLTGFGTQSHFIYFYSVYTDLQIFIHLSIYLLLCRWPKITWYTCGGQRISFVESGFLLPLLIRVPEIELSSPGIFIQWAILLTLNTKLVFFSFFFKYYISYFFFEARKWPSVLGMHKLKAWRWRNGKRQMGTIRSQLQKEGQGSWRDGDRPLKKQKEELCTFPP